MTNPLSSTSKSIVIRSQEEYFSLVESAKIKNNFQILTNHDSDFYIISENETYTVYTKIPEMFANIEF